MNKEQISQLNQYRFGPGTTPRPTCPICQESIKICSLNDGTYECHSSICRKDKTKAGKKFSSISGTMLSGVHNTEAYIKAAGYIYPHIGQRLVRYSEINKISRLGSSKIAKHVTDTIYHAMQPPYTMLNGGNFLGKRCCVGGVNWEARCTNIKEANNKERVKIFLFLHLIGTSTYKTRVTKSIRDLDYKKLSIRSAYYTKGENYDYVLMTHYRLRDLCDEVQFSCPDDDNDIYNGKNRKNRSLFPPKYFNHLPPQQIEPSKMRNCINSEKIELLHQLNSINPSLKNLGRFLCEYVYMRNITLQKDVPCQFKTLKSSEEDLLYNLLTPISYLGVIIKKNIPPGKGVTLADLTKLQILPHYK